MDLLQCGYAYDGTLVLDYETVVDSRSVQMALDVHNFNCFKGCKHSCPCQKSGRETAFLLCGCCYKRNGFPPLRKAQPPMDCENKFNTDVNWDALTRSRLILNGDCILQSTRPRGETDSSL